MPIGSLFETWWAAYPRKVGKKAAAKAYAGAVRGGAGPGLLLDALRRYRWPDDPQFVPHPTTWLNQGRWDDVPPEDVTSRIGRNPSNI